MVLPVESDIDVDFVDLEHGVLLKALVHTMTCGAKPYRIDLGVDVTHFQSIFKIVKPESKVLKSRISNLKSYTQSSLVWSAIRFQVSSRDFI